MSGISIKLPEDAIIVLTVDGGNSVEPQKQKCSQVGILHPGERVDLVMDWDLVMSDNTPFFQIVMDRE